MAILAVGKLDLVDIGDALDDVGHLFAEASRNLLAGGGRVLYRVVQKARGDGRRVHLHLRQHFGHFERMNNVRLTRGAHLPAMMLEAELPGFADQREVIAGPVGVNQVEKGFDPPVNGMLIHEELVRAMHLWLRLPGRSRGHARNLCRNGLRDRRHASL